MFGLVDTIPTGAWRAHGVLLAGAMPPDDYDAVAEGCVKVAQWASSISRVSPPAPGLQPGVDPVESPDMRGAVENLPGLCLRAREILHQLAYAPDSADEVERSAS